MPRSFHAPIRWMFLGHSFSPSWMPGAKKRVSLKKRIQDFPITKPVPGVRKRAIACLKAQAMCGEDYDRFSTAVLKQEETINHRFSIGPIGSRRYRQNRTRVERTLAAGWRKRSRHRTECHSRLCHQSRHVL